MKCVLTYPFLAQGFLCPEAFFHDVNQSLEILSSIIPCRLIGSGQDMSEDPVLVLVQCDDVGVDRTWRFKLDQPDRVQRKVLSAKLLQVSFASRRP